MDVDLITGKELASLLNVSTSTVRGWKVKGTGPPAYKLGGLVRYRRDEVLAWIRENRCVSSVQAQLNRKL